MNRIFSLSFACVVLLISSCTNFLEETPRTQLPAESYFSDPRTIEAAVNALYKIGPNSWYSPGAYDGNRHMQGGWISGLFDNLNYKGQEIWIQFAQTFTMTSNNVDVRMGNLFNDPYISIQRANLIIEILPTLDLVATGMTEAQRTRFDAEARFFRAQNYLWLVRHFGDVPMAIETQDSGDDMYLPRTDVKTIYESVIIPDLLKAIEVLPIRNQYNNSGRITATVASAHLIDAYVQMAGFPVNDASKWGLAAAEAKKFLPGGAYESFFKLEDNEDFEELSAYNKFRSVNVNSPSPGGRKLSSCLEFIYVCEYQSGITGAGFSNTAWSLEVGALGTTEAKVSITNNAYKPMPRRLAVYDTVNVRDLRMKERQFFANYYDKMDGSRFPNPELNTPSPYFFHDWGAMKLENNSGRHFAIYRLAEMYLFAAEAIAKSEGVTAQAVDALATIRARAYEWGYDEAERESGKPKTDVVTELSTLSVDRFIEEVWVERYREFVFEFKDWNLIQRTRKYPKTNPMDSSIPLGTARFVDITTVGTDFSGGKLFSLDYLLWPLPESQLQRNPNLVNNPGYEGKP